MNKHAERLRQAATRIEAIDTAATGIVGVGLREAADEIDSLVSKLDALQEELAAEREITSREWPMRDEALRRNAELQSRLEEALGRDRKGDTIIHELTLERDRLAGRLDSCRKYLEDVMRRCPGVNDKSLVAGNALNELNGAVIHPSAVERQTLCQHGQYPDSCPVCRV